MLGLGQPRAVKGPSNPHRCTATLALECRRHCGYSNTSCKTQRHLIKSSNLKGHLEVQPVPIQRGQRGVKESHRLLHYCTITSLALVGAMANHHTSFWGRNAPNHVVLRSGYGVHLRYTVENCGFSAVHARPHRRKQLFYG